MKCPRHKCDGELSEVFFGDRPRRWRCLNPDCNSLFSEHEWEENGTEIVRKDKVRGGK